ncbi:MAG: cytochrome b/b6 domain-containing protein, partial [Rhodobacteraceae bacterium]|nr:cytochrome b/b6 domain-containing protein [Paracoccaceae bacterium]
MSLANTKTSYGAVARGFHWLTALLILSAIPLGLIANDIAHAIKDPAIATTDADLSRAALLFSLHKTIGVTVFFVALARILWAIGQTKPGLLNGDNRLEAMAAETAHWLL